jgi:hypothetical protein
MAEPLRETNSARSTALSDGIRSKLTASIIIRTYGFVK